MNTAIPKKLQPILWSTSVELLDIQKDKVYIIHQVLIYGTLDEIKFPEKTFKYKKDNREKTFRALPLSC